MTVYYICQSKMDILSSAGVHKDLIANGRPWRRSGGACEPGYESCRQVPRFFSLSRLMWNFEKEGAQLLLAQTGVCEKPFGGRVESGQSTEFWSFRPEFRIFCP